MSPRILIIGGVAGGMSAAARARRINESASITVLERGGYVSFANCGLPYYLAGRIIGEEKLLVTTAARMKQRFNIDVRLGHEVTRIDRRAKTVEGFDLKTNQRFSLPYDKLILAPGAGAIVPDMPHAEAQNVFQLRSMEDTQRLHAFLTRQKPRTAVIVGAGFIGLEMAEALRDRHIEVTIVEKAPHALPMLDADMAAWVHKELAAKQVTLIAGEGLASFSAVGDRVTHVHTEKGAIVAADMVLLSIGVRPSVSLAREAGVALGSTGAIAVDAHQRTSDPDIYAVGDAAEVIHGVAGKPARIPLAGPANRQGRIAGQHAASGESAFAGPVLGTAIVQVFGLSIGITGLSEVAARAAGFDADTAIVHPANHATYYPGAQPIHMKLVYDKLTGRVLGAQVAGGQGVDKRLDVVATAIHFNGTIDDLAQLDLAYAPQFGSAKDPIHLAAFVAQNQLADLTPATAAPSAGDQIIDVRTPAENAAGTLPGAINIPVDELRDRLSEIDKSKPVAVLCQVGLRGHIATRILKQHGFDAHNLKGGWVTASTRT